MSEKFVPEIIHEIILYLKEDKKSLYSCILVSRDWCREAICLLWRQPFHFLYTCNTCSTSTSSKFKRPKLKRRCRCSKMKQAAANLLETYLSIEYNDELVKKGIITKDIMFNYLEFLCTLDLRELYTAIKWWSLQWHSLGYNRSDFKEFVNTKLGLTTFFDSIKIVLHHMFEFLYTNSPKLKSLSLDIEACLHLEHFEDAMVNELLIGEPKTPEIKQVFASLTELVSTRNTNKAQLFSSLSQNCHNIQKLVIRTKIPTKSSYGKEVTLVETKQLVSLIRSQRNLVYFELFDTVMSIEEILKALEETQCNSLKVLILNEVFVDDNDTILFYLKYLQNLRELKFNKCIYRKKSIEIKNGWEDL